MASEPTILDLIIIGAGPAGLTAAVYFGRFRRRCLVLEDGHSRARWIPTSHNIPGFPSGIGGEALLAALTDQAQQYGASIRKVHVMSLTHKDNIFTIVSDKGSIFRSRYVLLATGVRDKVSNIRGAADAISRGILRVCPICDAYEAIDRHIAVIGSGPLAEREAHFLSRYSKAISLLDINAVGLSSISTPGIEHIPARLATIAVIGDRIAMTSAQGQERVFDVGYLALGCSPQHALARALDADCDELGALTVSAHQETSVPGLYAAGDLVRGLSQVVVAAAEAAIATVNIHHRLLTADD